MDTIIDGKIDLFSELSAEQFGRVARYASIQRFQSGEHLFYQNEAITSIYFLLSGRIKMYRLNSQGKEQIISVLKSGKMFPHMWFDGNHGYPANSQCMDDVCVLTYRKDDFVSMLEETPLISIKLLENLGAVIQELQTRLEEQVLNNSMQQVVSLLLRLAKESGLQQADGSVILELDLTLIDLGKMIGATRETISRAISHLKEVGVVTEVSKYTLQFHERNLSQFLGPMEK